MSSTRAGATRRRPFLASALPRAAAPRPAQGRTQNPGRLQAAILLVLAAALSGFTILRGIAPHDEGLMLQAGARIVAGQWPYHDFWTNYPPGQPLVLAGLQELFGPSLLAWRILRVLTDAVVALLAYRLARRRCGESYALLAWLAAAGAMAFPTGPGPNPSALALALGALLLARKRPLAAGALAGLTCVFRIEVGIAAAVGAVLAAPRGARLKTGTTAAIVALLCLAPFFLAAPGPMLHDLFGFYAIQDLQRLPFPLGYAGPLRPSKLIEFYMPLILVLGCALWVVAIGVRTAAAARSTAALRLGVGATGRPVYPDAGSLALAPLAFVGLAYLLGRTDEFHLIPLTVVLAVMLATAAAVAASWIRVVPLVALALIALHGLDRQAGQLLHPPKLAAVPGQAGDGVQTDASDARALRGLELSIARLTRPGEPIFVANPRDDIVQAGDPLLYVILGHPNPTRYDVMQPGLVTTAPVQREIIGSLQRSRVRVAIRWLDPRATMIEHDGADRSSGVHLLDAYLSSHFRRYARFGAYQVLVRSG
jgi:hypothetical protein